MTQPHVLRREQLVATACCATTAGLCWLSLPPLALWPLGFVALVPVLVAVRRAKTVRGAALLGFACWFVTATGVCWWLAPAMQRFAGGSGALGVLGLGAYAAWEGLRLALACALWKFCCAPPEQEPLRFAFALLTIEMLFPQVFPCPFGILIAESLHFSQLAVLGGGASLTALVALSNGVGAVLLSPTARTRGTQFALWMGTYSLVLAAAGGFGFVRIADPHLFSGGESTRTVRIAVIQGGADTDTKRQKPRELLTRYAQATRALTRSSSVPDLVVWPETAIVVPLPETDAGHALRMRLGDSTGSNSALLTGANVLASKPGTPVQLFNSALLLDEAGRACRRCRYDKQRLVPFAESLPVTALRPLFPAGGRYRSGSTAQPLVWRDRQLGVMLCFEALDAGTARSLVRQGAEVLINLTNDGWFIPGSEPRLHFTLARLRAIEHERYLVRAAERGISAIVDPRGRVVRASQGLVFRDTLVERVELLRSRTPYALYGDIPWRLVAFAFLFLTARTGYRCRVTHRRGDLDAPGRPNRRPSSSA